MHRGIIKVKQADGNLVPFYPKTKTECIYDYRTNQNISAVVSQMEDDIEAAASSGGVKMVAFDLNENIPDSAMNGYSNETLAIFYDDISWSFTVDTKLVNSTNKTTGIPFNLYDQDGVVLDVDWGDGTTSTLTSSQYTEGDTSASVHVYANPGTYTIKISSEQWNDAYIITNYYLISPVQTYHTSLYWFKSTLKTINNAIPSIKGVKYYTASNQYNLYTLESNNFSYLLAECTSLQTVPKNLFSKNAKVTNLYACFYGCSSLQSIPSGLFDKNTAVTSFQYCFHNCSTLSSIPSGLFANNTAATNFYMCFAYCTSLQSIPSVLFDNNTAVTSFSSCFRKCRSITSIPSGLFDNNTAAINFQNCFYQCTSLQSIPSGLFDNNTEATNFSQCFYGCSSIQSIPSGLFDNNTEATNFSQCFYGCSSLQSIPSGLFDNNTTATDFASCFYNCSSLTSIPSRLFDNNVAATGFGYCFYGCSSIQSIPEGLFDNNTAATSFGSCFRNCSSLQSIPSELFANNTAVTNFSSCFVDCTALGGFTIHIGSSSVSNCSSFVTKKTGTTRRVYVPSGSTTQTTFNSVKTSLGLTIIGE